MAGEVVGEFGVELEEEDEEVLADFASGERGGGGFRWVEPVLGRR